MKTLKKSNNYLFFFSILFLFFSCNNTTDNEVIDVIDDPIGIDLDIPPFDFNRPTGIYALGPGTQQPLSSRSNGIIDKPYVDGYAFRIAWSELETAEGIYDFSPLDEAVKKLEAVDQKLTLSLFATSVPQYILDAPGVETFFGIGTRSGGSQDELRVVTWDAYGLERLEIFIQALATHQLPDAAIGNQMVAFKDHPVLSQITASILGISSIRDKEQRLVNSSGYERQKFINATVRSIHAVGDNFSEKHFFTGFFGMKDDNNSPALEDVLFERFMDEFDGVKNPRLGLFQENLACETPVPTFAWTLDQAKEQTFTMFQMLQGWKNPFSDPTKTDICLTDTSGPETGMIHAFETYNCRYFEVYEGDLKFQGFENRLQQMHDFLETTLP